MTHLTCMLGPLDLCLVIVEIPLLLALEIGDCIFKLTDVLLGDKKLLFAGVLLFQISGQVRNLLPCILLHFHALSFKLFGLLLLLELEQHGI